MTITAGAAQVEVSPVFPAWRRKVNAEVTGSHMTAIGRRGGEQVTSGFESGTSRLGEGLKRGVRTGIVALGAMGTAAGVLGLKTAAAGENAEIAFTTMLRSGSKARKFLGELKDFAANTPFDLPELQTASQSLVSAGINADKVIPIMRTLGDVTAGMGTGQEGIKRATVAIQQMQAAQKISGEDLNQLRDAGIPVYDLLAKSTGRAKGEVVELARQGKLGKKDLDAMMRGLETGKGLERFNGMMEKQSKSLSGTWSNLKETTTMGLADAVQPLLPTVKKGLVGLANLIKQNAPRLRAGMQGLVDSGPRITAFFRSLNTPENRASFSSLKDAFASLGPAMSQAKGEGPKLASVVDGVASAVRFAGEHVDTLVKYAPAFLGLLAGYKTLQAANNLLGRQSAIGMGLQVAATFTLARANKSLAVSQRAVAVSTGQATAAEKVGLLTRIRTRVATIASTIAEMAATAAKKAGAIATRVLNAVMRMNPLGIVITALTALGVGLVIAYKKSETFRRIVDGAFTKVKAAASSVVGWFRKTALPWMTGAFASIGNAGKWLWQKALGPAFRGIGTVISWWYRNVVKRYFSLVGTVLRGAGRVGMWLWRNALAPAFRGIGVVTSWLWSKAIRPTFSRIGSAFRTAASVAKWLYRNGIRPAFQSIGDKAGWLWGKAKSVFDKLKSGIRAVKNAFSGAKTGIGKIWSGLSSTISAPITAALKWIENNFLKKVRSVLRAIGADGLAKKIPILGTTGAKGYTEQSVRQSSGDAKYATGGTVRGHSPTATSDNIPAWLTAGEYVLPVKATRNLAAQVGAAGLEKLRRGVLPGYAMGGKVQGLNADFLKKLQEWNAALGNRYFVNSGYRSIEHQTRLWNASDKSGRMVARPGGSNHNFGVAADLGPATTPGHRALAARYGLRFPMSWEPWHIEPTGARGMRNGERSSGGGVFSGLAGKIMEQGAKALTSLLGKAPGGFWAQAGAASMKHTVDAIVSRVKDAGASSGGSIGGFTSKAGGSNVALGRRMAAAAGWTGNEWLSLKELWTKESNWNHRANNPSSGAYGIPQSLPGSKMASSGADWRTNPATQIDWGIKYIKGRPDYGRPSKALSLWRSRSPHWYSDGGPVTGYAGGTHNATPGPHWVGEHGRELVWFRGGERVTSNSRSQQVSSRPTGPQRIYGELTMRDGRAYIEGIAEDVFTDMNEGASALAGMGRS